MSFLTFTLATWTGVFATMVALGLVYVGIDRLAAKAGCSAAQGGGNAALPKARASRMSAYL